MHMPALCVAALALVVEASASKWTQFSVASPVPRGPGASVLVNTPGGSGSTLVMSMLRDAHVSINSPYNADTLKHKSAAALSSLLQQRVIAKVYDRVLIVVNRDMARAVASTVERFALQHYILGLLPGCTDCYNCNCWGGKKKRSAGERNQLKTPPSWRSKKGTALLRAIYASAAQTGRDTYGVGFHFDSWSHAQRYEAARWPPMPPAGRQFYSWTSLPLLTPPLVASSAPSLDATTRSSLSVCVPRSPRSWKEPGTTPPNTLTRGRS